MVEVARDFPEASLLAQRCLFHVLVLVDPRRPWAQLQAACAESDGLPATVLLIEPQNRAASAVKALRGGATDVLLRPFSTDELVAAITALGRGIAAVPGDREPVSGRARPPGYPENWTLEEVKNHHMARVLAASDGNKSAAARRLGVSRKTLERRLGSGSHRKRGNDEQQDYRQRSNE
jgi:DNA-binding NtrC family response regulator